jgi:hypothetical protein
VTKRFKSSGIARPFLLKHNTTQHNHSESLPSMSVKGKAAQIDKVGGSDEFHVREIEFPNPGPNEVRVRVLASSVNPIDYKMRGYNFWGAQFPAIIGIDGKRSVVDQTNRADRFFFYFPKQLPALWMLSVRK